jgi:hypothetical protein
VARVDHDENMIVRLSLTRRRHVDYVRVVAQGCRG